VEVKSKTGWVAAGLGSTGLLQGLYGAVQSLAAAYGQHAHLGPTAPHSPRAGSYRRMRKQEAKSSWLAGAGLVVATLAAKAGLFELGALFWAR
jgi:hypothetical protein